MAFPTIPTVAGNTLLSSATTTASTTHTFPSLTTLGHNAGDLLIAICVQYQGGTANAEFSAWGASFTETRDDATVTALDQAVGVAHKIATGSESGTFTVTSAHSFQSINFLMRIPAATWRGTTIPEVLAVVRATGAVADPGALTPSWGADDTLWIAVGGHSETTTTGSPPTLTASPTNYSGDLIVARAADAVGNITAGVGFRQLNASSENVGTWTATNANRGNGAATVIAIRPAAVMPTITDTGLTLTDTIVTNVTYAISDTGLTLSDAVQKPAISINISDTLSGNKAALVGSRGSRASSSSGILTVSGNATVGNTVFLIGSYASTTNAHLGSVTDSRGNVWSGFQGIQTGGGDYLFIYYTHQDAGQLLNGDTITIHPLSGNIRSCVMSAQEFQGIWANGADDKSGTSNLLGTGTSIPTGSTFTLSQANELVIALVSVEITSVTITSDATLTDFATNNDLLIAGDTHIRLQHKIVTSTSAVSGTLTCSPASGTGSRNGLIASFRAVTAFEGSKPAIQIVRPLADAGLTCTDSIGLTKFRTISDTGLTNSDSTKKKVFKFVSDTGLTVTDTFLARLLVDRGLFLSDTLTKGIAISDTGLNATYSELLSEFLGFQTLIAFGNTLYATVRKNISPNDFVIRISNPINSDLSVYEELDLFANNNWPIGPDANSRHIISADNKIYLSPQMEPNPLDGGSTFWFRVMRIDPYGGSLSNSTDIALSDQNTGLSTSTNSATSGPIAVVGNYIYYVFGNTISSGDPAQVSKYDLRTGNFVGKRILTGVYGANCISTDGVRLYIAGRSSGSSNVWAAWVELDLSNHSILDLGVTGGNFTQDSFLLSDSFYFASGTSANNKLWKVKKDLSSSSSLDLQNTQSQSGLTFDGQYAYITAAASSNNGSVIVVGPLPSTMAISSIIAFSQGQGNTQAVTTIGDKLFTGINQANTSLIRSGLTAGYDSITLPHRPQLVDRGLTISSTLTKNLFPISNTGLTLSDSLQKVVQHNITDTGLTISDSIVASHAKEAVLTDTGMGPQILDTFTSGMSATWTYPVIFGDTAMQSDGAGHVQGSGNSSDSYWNVLFGPDCESSLYVVTPQALDSGNFFYLYVRLTNPGLTTKTGYSAIIKNSSFANDSYRIQRIDSGSAYGTQIAIGGTGGTDVTAGDRFLLAVVGSNITLYRNGVAVLTATDSTYQAAGFTGIGSDFQDGLFDNFSAGIIADSIVAIKTGGGGGSLTITDTGLSISDSLITNRNRQLSDTGLTVTSTTVTNVTRAKTDTGLTITDSMVSNRNRVFSTTGLTNTDSLVDQSSRNRTISDTGLTESDTLVHAVIRSDSDTGLNISDSLQKVARHNITDTGATVTDSMVSNRTRILTDTGATNTDSLQKVARHNITDTGATVTDTTISNRTRVFSDTGLTESDTTQKVARHNITDTGLTNTDTLVHLVIHTDSDTGLTISDTLQKSASKNLADTGLTESDSSITNRTRFFSDTGLTNSDSIVRTSIHSVSISDTGLANTSTLVINITRVFATTGLTNTDSIARTSTHPRTIADTGLTETDSLVHAVVRSDSDTGLNISDSIARTASHNISLTDTGATITDSAIRLVSHFDSDTGLSNTDSIARTSSHSISISDTGLTETDSAASRRTRALTDTGLTNTDSLSETSTHSRTISDTGLTESDSLVHAATRSDSDTGLNISDTTRKSVSKFVSDTGLNLSDVISTGGHIAIVDTGLSNSDSTARTALHFRTDSDTGLTLTDSAISNRTRVFSDTGLTNSDSTSRTAVHNIAISDTGLSITDTLIHQVTRLDSDTGLTINDSTSRTASHFRTATDTGLTESDSITLAGGLSITDTGLTISDSAVTTAKHFRTDSDTGLSISDTLATSRTRLISDTGLTESDSIARSASHNIALSDTGLSLTDTLSHAVIRSDADTGLNIGDAIQKSARHNVSDTGLTESDSIASSANGAVNITDTGLTLSDSISRTARHNVTASDTGLTVSDSVAVAIIKPRSLTDTGLTESDSTARTASHNRSVTDSLTFSDSLQHHVFKSDADTGLTISDTLVRGGSIFLSDTGITVSDSITKFASKSISTTGLNLSDSLTNLPVFYRTISDTGITESDSISVVKVSQTIPISDTGLTLSDFIQKQVSLHISDSGAAITDNLLFVPQVVRGFYKVALGRDGYYRAYITRWRS